MAQAAAESGADWVGLVFVDGSPRRVTAEQAQEVVAALPASVEPVGLFVDQPVELVRRLAGELGMRTVQLQGRETPEYVRSLAPLKVIRSLAFHADSAAESLQPWLAPCENLLALIWDAPPYTTAQGQRLTGGGGKSLDWQTLANFMHAMRETPMPSWMLSGGLTPANVRQAVEMLHPWGVDVSSGVESSRGIKDDRLIRAFGQAVKAADGR